MDTWFEAGHVAIVTGGSRGLGKALARELLQRGLHVVIDGRDAETLEAAARELRAYGEIVAVRGDVNAPEHIHDLFARARAFGRLDLVVNNASTLGAVPLPAVADLTQQTFRALFETNVFAPIHVMQHALDFMRRLGTPGTIVNVTSDAAVQAYSGWGGYGAAKAALEHVSRVLAAEIEGSGIRVLLVDPGDMDTQMHREAIPEADPKDLRDPKDSARALLQAIAGMSSSFERRSPADEATA